MPVLRQDVNTGSSELRLGAANYMVGTAAPQVQEVQPESGRRDQAIAGFLQGFMGSFEPALQESQKRAQAQGMIDATQDPEALKNSESAVDRQNWLLQDAYQKGYLGAAVQQNVTDFQTGAMDRAQKAALAGVSDEEFLQSERQQSAQLINSLQQYMPHLSPEAMASVAASLDNTKNSVLSTLRKTRAGQASINNTRAIQQGSFQAQQLFLQQTQVDGFDQAWHFLEDQAGMIGTNALMDEKTKRQELHNLFLTTAQSLDNPDDINKLAQKASGILGTTDPALTSALHGEWKRAGEKMQGAALMSIQNDYDSIAKLPVYQQAEAKRALEDKLIQMQTNGQISTGQMMDYYNKMHKEQTPKLQMQGMVQSLVSSGGGISVEALHAAAPGVTRSEIQSQIREAYPNTMQGNAQMLAAGSAGSDPWVVKEALSRVGTQMTDQLDTLSTLMKPVTDDDGNVTYQIPQSVQENLVGFMSMYQAGDAITQQTLMNTLPQDWQGVIRSAIEQDPSNMNNNVLDTIKRVAVEKASGQFKDVPAQPSAKMLDTESALAWYQRINPFTTDSEESQRAAMNQQLQAEYSRLYNTDRGLLSGKSPETIGKMLVGNIQARTVPLQVGKFNANVTLPAGTTIDSYAKAAGVDAGTFQKALQSVSDSVFQAQGISPDRLDSVRIEPNTGGALSKDFTMTVYTKSQSGIYTASRIALPMTAIAGKAKSDYQAMLDQQRADGSQKAGLNVSTFQDYSTGGYRTMEVSGTNSVGIAPNTFNKLLADTMRYEGFKGSKSGGSVGYGWHEASGDSVPDKITIPQAQQKLKELYETRYIPMVQGYIKASGLRGESSMPMLADLAYQRPADAKAMVEVMAKYQRGEADYPEVVSTLKGLPSYKDAGGGDDTVRNKDRLDYLYRWASLDGSRSRDIRQNPVAALMPR